MATKPCFQRRCHLFFRGEVREVKAEQSEHFEERQLTLSGIGASSNLDKATESNKEKRRKALSPTAAPNRGLCVHDWYLMPEAYSEVLVLDAIEKYGIKPGNVILDPFSGTGTTAITAALNGIDAVGLEVNPFLYFASKVKLNWQIDLKQFKESLQCVTEEIRPHLESLTVNSGSEISPNRSSMEKTRDILANASEPSMPRLYEWMTEVVVQKVLIIRYVIEKYVPIEIQPHFLLALASILCPVSNMRLTPHAFGSQKRKEDAPAYELFVQKLEKIYEDLKCLQVSKKPFGQAQIYNCDSRSASSIKSDSFPVDLAITSPPYLNNLDYTMQTRMELFFLNFVSSMADLRNLRKAMVICDAKAMYKDVKDSEIVQNIQTIQNLASQLREAHVGKNWGWDYAFMTTQYFGGMYKILQSVQPVLKDKAKFILVVGESVHSGVKLPLPDIIAELGEMTGYKLEEINVIRKRRSSSHKHEVSESEVVLQKTSSKSFF